jgi:hypothetical protein
LATSRRFLSRLSDRYAGTRTRTVTAAAADQVAIITAVPPDGAVSAARARQTIGQALTGGFRAPSGHAKIPERLALGLVEQLIEFAWRELAAPAIRNANSVPGCFELAGFGNGDH